MIDPNEEEIVWGPVFDKRGWIRKRVISAIAISDKNVHMVFFEEGPDKGSHTLPIQEIDDVVVTDQYRVSDSQFNFYSTRGSYIRAGAGNVGGSSRMVGNVLFLDKEGRNFKFKDVADPQGVRALVLTLKKNLLLEKESKV